MFNVSILIDSSTVVKGTNPAGGSCVIVKRAKVVLTRVETTFHSLLTNDTFAGGFLHKCDHSVFATSDLVAWIYIYIYIYEYSVTDIFKDVVSERVTLLTLLTLILKVDLDVIPSSRRRHLMCSSFTVVP